MPRVDAISSQGQTALRRYLLALDAENPPGGESFIFPVTQSGAAYTDARPWVIETGLMPNAAGPAQANSVFCLGYNVDANTQQKDTAEPGAGYYVEACYNEPAQSYAPTIELYCSAVDNVAGWNTRPWFYQIDRSNGYVLAANLQIPRTAAFSFSWSNGTTVGEAVANLTRNLWKQYAADLTAPNRFQLLGKNAAGTASSSTSQLELGYGTTDNALIITPASATIIDFLVGSQRFIRTYRVGDGGGTHPYSGNLCIGNGGDSNGHHLYVNGTRGWNNMTTFGVVKNASANSKAVQVLESDGSTERFVIDGNWNIELGKKAALNTTDSNGFPFVPTMNGAPTGTPSKTGMAPIVVDDLNNRVYFRVGTTWRYAALQT